MAETATPVAGTPATNWRQRLRRLPKRYWLYAAVLLLIVGWCLFPGPRPRQATLAGTPSEMGEAFGRGHRLFTRLLCRLYIKGFICGNDAGVVKERREKALTLWPCLQSAYQEELMGLSRGAGVDHGLLLLGNSFIDLGFSASGCRAIVSTQGPELLHAHNLDWDSVGGLANWGITIVRRAPTDGRLRTVSIALPGMVGALDIINERGVALSLNQISYGSGEKTEPVFIRMRRIAEQCADYAAAKAEIEKIPPTTPFILTLSSARERRGGVFEPVGGRITERPPENALVCADNVTWGKAFRQSEVDRGVRRHKVADIAGMQAALRDKDVLLACNIYSVIFDFAGNRLLLASGKTPAAAGTYREYTLFAAPSLSQGRPVDRD